MSVSKRLKEYLMEGLAPMRIPEPDLPIRRESVIAIVWITSNRVINWYDKRVSEWTCAGRWEG